MVPTEMTPLENGSPGVSTVMALIGPTMVIETAPVFASTWALAVPELTTSRAARARMSRVRPARRAGRRGPPTNRFRIFVACIMPLPFCADLARLTPQINSYRTHRPSQLVVTLPAELVQHLL